MQKYYFKVDTEYGAMPLVIKANNLNEAEKKLLENYKINSIKIKSDKPIMSKIKETPITLASISTIGKLHLGNDKYVAKF